MKLIREAELAADWGLSLEQMRVMRRRHGWAHVKFSRQDIRYTDAQVEQIVRERTTRADVTPIDKSGQTSRSAKRSA